MEQSSGKVTVYIVFAVLVFGAVAIDALWLRAALAALCGGFLTMAALRPLASTGDAGSSAGPARPSSAPTEEERRRDASVRQQIQALLDLIREFYSTCHMVAVGQLEPSKAKTKAQEVEGKLNAMMASMLEKIEAAEGEEA